MNLPHSDSQIFMSTEPVDMRKAIDGLATIVQTQFQMDPFGNCLYIFCNRKCDKCKILHWSNNGWWLYYRKLCKGVFQWKFNQNSIVLEISEREFQWLMQGLSMEQPTAHKPVEQRIFL